MANVAKLTAGRIGALTPEAKDYTLFEDATPGFGVRVYPTGQRRFVFRYRAGNSRSAPTRMFTIADAKKVGLEDARRIARDLAGKVARGEDPSQAKRDTEAARERARTFAQVRADFLAKHVDAKLRASTAAEYRRVLEKDFACLDAKPFDEVTQADIADAIQVIADRGKVRMANLARAYVRKLYSWAGAKGLSADNLAKRTEKAGKDVRRERALSREELGEVYRAALAAGGSFGAAVRFLMLTGQRRGEVFGLVDSEIDTGGRLWKLHEERTKNKTKHDVPLSATALAILATRPGKGLAFGTSQGNVHGNPVKARNGLDARVLAARRALNPKAEGMAPWTLHDLRRSFVTHAHGALKVPIPVLERAINHKSGTFAGVVGIYNRAELLDERRQAFDDWEAWLLAAAGLARGHAEPESKPRGAK